MRGISVAAMSLALLSMLALSFTQQRQLRRSWDREQSMARAWDEYKAAVERERAALRGLIDEQRRLITTLRATR